ncbi:MAG TPA: hypothetical protein VFB36_02035 [Nevskiaceae bacterium]|nr:hypothetical protein [Nevskiaceae bacterium]
MNEFSQSEGGDLTSGVDHLSVLRRQVFCRRSLPHGWRPRPSTVLNEDGWIVGTPRRKRLHPSASKPAPALTVLPVLDQHAF